MKVLVYSDLQAEEGSLRLRSDPTIPVQRWRTKRFYEWATQLVKSKGIDAVWDLGDTTDNRTAIAHPTLDAVATGCAQLTRGLDRVLCLKLLGNHEQHIKAATSHCGALFSPYFRVISGSEVVVWGDLSIICTAYHTETAPQAVWLNQTIKEHKSRGQRVVVLGHVQIKGCRLASGLSNDGIPTAALDEADLVLLGHVHRRQPIGKNGMYVGSPFQQDFGEANDPRKTVAIVDTDTLEVSLVHPPGFPQYRTITVDELDAATKGNDILSVIIRNQDEAERFYASPSAAQAEPVYAFSEAPVEKVETSEDLTFESLVRRRVELDPLEGVDQETLISAGLALR